MWLKTKFKNDDSVRLETPYLGCRITGKDIHELTCHKTINSFPFMVYTKVNFRKIFSSGLCSDLSKC